jgi:tetratricopeptide (TPR) repeat protein
VNGNLLNNIALCNAGIGDYETACEYYEKAIARKKAEGESELAIAETEMNMASSLGFANKLEEALAVNERVLEVYSRFYDKVSVRESMRAHL